MDVFNYSLKIQELDRAKYKKQYIAILRETHQNLLDGGHRHYGRHLYVGITHENAAETLLLYKIYAKAINDITDHVGVPDFIIDGFNALETKVVEYIVKENEYALYLDTFKYSKDISCPTGHISKILTTIIEMVEDKEYPYKFQFGAYVSSMYSNVGYNINAPSYQSFSLGNAGRTGMQLLIELEDYKTTLNSNIRYTVLEEILDEFYASYKQASNPTAMDDIRLSAQRIVDALDVIKDRTNGQLSTQAPAA